MQPGATVVLATVWLAVYANLVGTLRINFTADQYSPLAPQHQRHEVHRRAEGQPSAWEDPNFGSQGRSHESRHSLLARRSRDSVADDISSLAEDKRPGGELTDDNRGAKSALSPPVEFEDPFVADDTFQDQGPGSVEIYKLDVFRVNSLLRPSSPSIITRFPPEWTSKSKSKAPKKTNYASWKSKTPDYGKANGLLNTLRKQSNSFDDLSTEVPPANTDGSFGIGGVPELQVGCEGLEAAVSDHDRERRSIDSTVTGDKNPKREGVDPSWIDVTPISLNLDYELSGEEGYEEMDELLKLKKLESTTKRSRLNRGDMDATLHSVFHDGEHRAEKLPVRGDLGKSRASNESSVSSAERQSNRQVEEKTKLAADEALRFNEGKRDDYAARSDDETPAGNQRRKILWLEEPDVEQQLKGNGERRERDTWGFGEDEGVVSSDELQTENQRRRLAYERRNMIRQEELRRSEEQRRRAEEALRRNQIENRTNNDIERIREEYDRRLSERERVEEERRRQLQQSNRWQLDEEHRRRLQEEVSRRNRLEEQRRTQELEALRRRETVIQRPASEEERKQWQQAIMTRRPEEEDRLREWDARRRFREEEARRKWDEELRRRQQEQDRRSLEERRREWMLKRKQEEEEARRRHQQSRNEPSNLLQPSRSSPNSNKSYDPETERRMREEQERERQRKLNEYIQRNRPIKVNSSIDREREEANERRQEEERRRAEEQRQRLEAERKLQDYVRRNQPVRVPKLNESYDENWLEYRRRLDEARQRNQSRYTGPGSGRRNHGPSAPTNIDPRYYVDDARREAARRIEKEKEEERIRERLRQQEQQEQLRRYALRREEEARRMQSRRYEEERKRQEAARLEAERRAKELQEEEARRNLAGRRPLENTRPSYENRRRFDDYRRRQDTSLIPANLVSNESRRAAERQRQEQEKRRDEAERQRAREAREKEEHDRVMKEHRRRQEEARLNALPVSASIIVRPATPNPLSRININIPRLNPYEEGIKVSNFPVPPTRQPPVKSPPPCVWAVVHCCPSKVNRLITCFESMGCPGINWDPSPCRASITQAAKNQVAKFYAETEDRDEYDYL
ncbi:trichohyalin-like [Frieseomelitta varia]|uniref:trichohyalin-like n=1 Tax=Frieseomelitta varia TaxID=561572 RepID=UPI001CB68486|nr:trichohyalin-like [Frieseomelitta varia]XP_043515131.1 trichohyalin-like [Frieseomelitta varia]XP_043515132.1 trichohyalin-like [Frieseomelitta varia]XP_043515133.1 trichohyalin-like [Frieseomelitta varia]